MVKNYLIFTCILATWAAVASGGAQSAPPSQPPARADCSTLIYNMMDCISFLSSGGDETTPDSACCVGLKTVLKLDADCVCYALSNAGSLGLDINMTRAEALPSECGVSASPIGNCNVSASPSASPANPPSTNIAPPSNSPSLPPTTPPPSAAAPSPAESAEAPSPAQSPGPLSPAESPEPPSPAAAPVSTSSAVGVPPSQATGPTPASSGDYTISSAFSAFLIAITSNFLVFNA